MPGASPQIHDASGGEGGSSKVGTLSRWLPTLSQFLNPNPTGGQPTPPSTSGGSPPQKGEHVCTPGSTNGQTLSAFMAPPPPPSPHPCSASPAEDGRLSQAPTTIGPPSEGVSGPAPPRALCRPHGVPSPLIRSQKPGLDVGRGNADGASALFLAAQNGHSDVVQLLLRDPRTDVNACTRGAPVCWCWTRGNRPICIVCWGHPRILSSHALARLHVPVPCTILSSAGGRAYRSALMHLQPPAFSSDAGSPRMGGCVYRIDSGSD